MKMLLVMGVFLYFSLSRLLTSGELVLFVGSHPEFSALGFTLVGIEVVISVLLILGVYSSLVYRRSYLGRIACLAMIIAGIVDPYSPFPYVESALGAFLFFIFSMRDVKDAYALKEGRPIEKEGVESADLTYPREKRKVGVICPNCGMHLPPSATVCRRCGTRIPY
jgi:hypothetical protein